jgi:hypothetical protein
MSEKSTSEKPLKSVKPSEKVKEIPPQGESHREHDIRTHKKEANKLNKESEEHGGQEGPDPTRYGDWESGGRCTDF